MSYSRNIGRDLLNVPMGEMIRDMAFAIAEAQVALDANSIEVAQMMGGLKTITDSNGNVTFRDSRVFFGREKMNLSNALDLYNTTRDEDLKQAIEAEHIDGNSSVEEIMSGTIGTDTYRLKPTAQDVVVSVPTRLSMLELGFTPTFYQFVDTIIEVHISINYSEEVSTSRTTESKPVTTVSTFGFASKTGSSYTGGLSRTVTTSQVNASYSARYNYSAEGSSLLRTKLTPVPPPTILEERIRQNMEVAMEENR